jgi:hypothetical protein
MHRKITYIDDSQLFEPYAFENLEIVERGGPGSGHHGHKGRPEEVGGSLPSKYGQHYQTNRPGLETYGSGVFTPMLSELIYSWQGNEGWGMAQHIFHTVSKAQERGDDSIQGLALGDNGELVGIAALRYGRPLRFDAPGIETDQMIFVDGMYSPRQGYAEEMLIRTAIEAAEHDRGIWLRVTEDARHFYASMGLDLVEGDTGDEYQYAYWTPEQVRSVAESAITPERVEGYIPPAAKPRLTIKFEDAYEEIIPSNPTTDEPPPAGIEEMGIEKRYRWENFNYSNWASEDRWDPYTFAVEEGEIDPKELNIYQDRIVDDLKAIHDGWIDGTDNFHSIRFSEAVAQEFGGEPIPEAKGLGTRNLDIAFDALAAKYGEDVVLAGRWESKEEWSAEDPQIKEKSLIEFAAFAEGAREEDLAADYTTVARKMYENTQARLKEAGFKEGDTVRLYRGLRANPEARLPKGKDGGWVDLDMYSISSWTFAKSTAGNFSSMRGGSGSKSNEGTLLTADIPIDRILAFWQTGPGSHGEFEYLVLGEGGIKAYMTKVNQKKPLYEVMEDISLKEIPQSGKPPGEYELGPEAE